MSTTPVSPFSDPAKPVLDQDPAINDTQRAQLWDVFHNSKDENELAQHLKDIAVPDDTKHRLFTAKQAVAPPVDPIKKTTSVMAQLAQIDPRVLDVAEAHPNVLKLLSTAAGIGAKPAAEPAGASKPAGKAKTPTAAPAAPAVTPDFPVTPPGHALVHASDGNLYHVPQEKIEAARALDPNLKVLHVEQGEEA